MQEMPSCSLIFFSKLQRRQHQCYCLVPQEWVRASNPLFNSFQASAAKYELFCVCVLCLERICKFLLLGVLFSSKPSQKSQRPTFYSIEARRYNVFSLRSFLYLAEEWSACGYVWYQCLLMGFNMIVILTRNRRARNVNAWFASRQNLLLGPASWLWIPNLLPPNTWACDAKLALREMSYARKNCVSSSLSLLLMLLDFLYVQGRQPCWETVSGFLQTSKAFNSMSSAILHMRSLVLLGSCNSHTLYERSATMLAGSCQHWQHKLICHTHCDDC